MPYVSESIVVDRNQKLVALVYPDYETAAQQNIPAEDLPGIMNENISALNKELPSYSQLSAVEIREEEFEKTPKRSIRRFLYK